MWAEDSFPGWLTHKTEDGAGCWKEISAPSCVDISIGLLEYPYNIAPGFLQREQTKQARENSQ